MISCIFCKVSADLEFGEVEIHQGTPHRLIMTAYCNNCNKQFEVDVETNNVNDDEGDFYFEMRCKPRWETAKTRRFNLETLTIEKPRGD